MHYIENRGKAVIEKGKQKNKSGAENTSRKKKKKSSSKMGINLEVLCRKCIKPSSPTPSHLQTFKFSLLDQLFPNLHGNLTLYFYPPHNNHTNSSFINHFSIRSQLLQNTLSQTLSHFYPLAGRVQDTSTLHCNDQGAVFIESRTDTTLSDILSFPNFDTLETLLPTTDKESMEISNGGMLLVRFTLFGCGGTALTLSLTHKIADIVVTITLLKAWSAACTGETPTVITNIAVGATLFPPREIIPGMSSGSVNITADGKFTTRRFVFEASKIEELKNRVKIAMFDFQPSRVETVLGLIWRCAMFSSRSKTASFKPSALFQAVNLRPRMDPAVPDTSIGNFVWPFAVIVEEENDVELHELVKKMRKSMRDFVETKVERFQEGGGFDVVMESLKERSELLKEKKDIVVYKCSSWCRFPLLEHDFGWGKPVWMSSVNNVVSNTIALMDTRDNGVEAFVTMGEEEMGFFQQNQELLHYALLNPSVV